jgi:hypothetical protein
MISSPLEKRAFGKTGSLENEVETFRQEVAKF